MPTSMTGRSGNPAALGLTLALNGAALVALIAWSPEVRKKVFDPIWVESIKAKPQELPVEVARPPAKSRSAVDAPAPRVPTPALDDFIVPPLDERPPIIVDRGPVITPDTGPAPSPPVPLAEPVRVAARLDARRSQLQPPYPAALQRAEIAGTVTVRVQVGRDGRPTAIELVRTDDPAFFAATERWGLRNWRFVPATADGQPIASSVTLTVRFTIE